MVERGCTWGGRSLDGLGGALTPSLLNTNKKSGWNVLESAASQNGFSERTVSGPDSNGLRPRPLLSSLFTTSCADSPPAAGDQRLVDDSTSDGCQTPTPTPTPGRVLDPIITGRPGPAQS